MRSWNGPLASALGGSRPALGRQHRASALFGATAAGVLGLQFGGVPLVDGQAIVVEQLFAGLDVAQGEDVDLLADDLGLGGTWKKTSYNTSGGAHALGGTPFRKNYAGIGFTYDRGRDAFIPPKPYNKWVLNEDSCLWEAPTQYTNDGNRYIWNDDAGQWDLEPDGQ